MGLEPAGHGGMIRLSIVTVQETPAQRLVNEGAKACSSRAEEEEEQTYEAGDEEESHG